MIGALFANTIYVKVRSNQYDLRHIERVKSMSVMAASPFTTDRMLIGQFTEAEKTLKTGLNKLFEGRWFTPKPIIIIHPLEKTEGGLSQVEERVLLEVAAGAGARRTIVWVGHELSDQEALSKSGGV
jgi:rod shape-determining protein MreB